MSSPKPALGHMHPPDWEKSALLCLVPRKFQQCCILITENVVESWISTQIQLYLRTNDNNLEGSRANQIFQHNKNKPTPSCRWRSDKEKKKNKNPLLEFQHYLSVQNLWGSEWSKIMSLINYYRQQVHDAKNTEIDAITDLWLGWESLLLLSEELF